MNNKTIYRKNKLTKYLLTISMLFSVFTFYGFVGQSISQQHKTTQTELVFSSKKTLKKKVFYKKAVSLSLESVLNSSLTYFKNVLMSYNVLTKVAFNSVSKKTQSFELINIFLQRKTIPQISDQDNFLFLISFQI